MIMVRCSEECPPACDFCIHKTRNEQQKEEGTVYCTILHQEMDVGSYCEHFHCFRVKES